MERCGRLRASGNRIPREHKVAYHWMSNQLAARVGQPPRNCRYPLWAWYQWGGAHRPRPDLRARAHLPSGQRGVRIEFDIDPRHVLLSDFDGWHAVLNRQYVPENDADAKAFEEQFESFGLLRSAEMELKIYQSWQHIFDLKRSSRGWGEDPSKLSIQAVLWELSLQQVRDMRFFIAR